MELNYNGILKDNLKSGISMHIPAIAREHHIKNIVSRKYSDMLDWLDLPYMSEEEIVRIETLGKYVNKKFDNLVILGIGGSALGIKMLQNTFVDSIHKDCGIKVYVCDNIDSDSFISLINTLNLKKTMVNVITKSGSTSETLAQFSIMLERFSAKRLDISKHFVVTTTKDNNLYKYAQAHNMQVLEIPVGVGGRFSVLSPVGLFPASAMNINIRELLKGARDIQDKLLKENDKNIAYTCAHINYMFLKKGCSNFVVMPYTDRLAYVPEFFAQLWAESLGKKFNRKGEVVHAGQTLIKTLGVTDQHSQLQIYSEGPFDKIIMFMAVKERTLNEKIQYELPFAKHLAGATLNDLINYEYDSTAYALTQENRPNYTILLDRIDEENIGKLIMFTELMTAYMGEMLNIDAFDQPGVELSKIYTKACLRMKGYENEYREIKAHKSNKNYIRI